MSDVKIDIIAKVTGGAAEDLNKIGGAADRLDGGMKKVDESAKKADASLKKAASPVTAAGLRDAATAALAVAAALTVATAAGAVSDERQQRALRALGPAYGEVQRATQGTVTATEAWRVQQSLLQTGLPTTGRELATITRAARDYAVATGTETTAAIEQLSQALANGEAGGLRRFGIAVTAGKTRTETFNSALEQLQRTQQGTAPVARTLGEEISHLGTQLTEAGGALAGFLSRVADAPDVLNVLSDRIHRNVSALAEFQDFMGRSTSNGTTGAVRGRIGGVRAPARAIDPRTAEGQRTGEASTALALRAAQSAEERANQPASGGGASGPSLEERQWAALQAQIVRTRAEAATHATQSAAEAAMVSERATRDKDELTALSLARRSLSDEERQSRYELAQLVHDQREAEIALREAASGGDAREERLSLRAADHAAATAALAEIDARIERARAEHASEEETNRLLRARVGIINQLVAVTPQLSALQRMSAEAMTNFNNSMRDSALGLSDAFGAATVAAIESNESFGASLASALRAQLKALTQEAVVMALKNTALGIAALVTAPAAAPAFFAAAGAWGGVAAVAGVTLASTSAPKPSAPSGGGGGSDRAASANAARASSESSGPLTLNINVSGALFNEGVEEGVVRALNGADARGLLQRRLRD